MIVLISSGQPTLNPRLVKEADTLTDAGFEVTVVYQFWNDWGTEYDSRLLPTKKWKSIRVGGSVKTQKYDYWKTRFIQKIAIFLATTIGFKNGIAERAIGRCTYKLARKAMAIPANLYLAHNLAALPAAYLAAKKNKAKCGFDAEDFHRNEVSNNEKSHDVQLKTFIEDKYLPKLDYFTTASPLISEAYHQIYQRLNPTTILNVFPKQNLEQRNGLTDKIKLFWFSQTIGQNRGLETVIAALGLLKNIDIELHLLGAHDAKMISLFKALASTNNFAPDKIIFYPPIAPDDIYKFSGRFDIGLATETNQPKNRDICLTNKIFTYIQSNLAIIASDTAAQTKLLKAFPDMGSVYEKDNPESLADVLKTYAENKMLLTGHRKQARKYADEALNWEIEGQKFLTTVQQLFKLN